MEVIESSEKPIINYLNAKIPIYPIFGRVKQIDIKKFLLLLFCSLKLFLYIQKIKFLSNVIIIKKVFVSRYQLPCNTNIKYNNYFKRQDLNKIIAYAIIDNT